MIGNASLIVQYDIQAQVRRHHSSVRIGRRLPLTWPCTAYGISQLCAFNLVINRMTAAYYFHRRHPRNLKSCPLFTLSLSSPSPEGLLVRKEACYRHLLWPSPPVRSSNPSPKLVITSGHVWIFLLGASLHQLYLEYKLPPGSYDRIHSLVFLGHMVIHFVDSSAVNRSNGHILG